MSAPDADSTTGETRSCGLPAGPCSAWQFLLDHPRMTLRRLGISFRRQDESNLAIHVVAEDPRYPMLCVNGDLNFVVSINPATGDIEGGRGCICAARSSAECICDLDPRDMGPVHRPLRDILPNAGREALPPSGQPPENG